MGKMIMALKKLAKKINGKAPESDNVVGIINGIADDYQGGGSTLYRHYLSVNDGLSETDGAGVLLHPYSQELDAEKLKQIIEAQGIPGWPNVERELSDSYMLPLGTVTLFSCYDETTNLLYYQESNGVAKAIVNVTDTPKDITLPTFN